MFADAIRCTHNGTGGAGTITLASTAGYPQPSDVFGTSGTRVVHYEICEYTDSTFLTLKNYESGVGSLVLSTGVLTRSTIRISWNSTTYNAANPTALSFGNTPANVQILLTGSAATQRPALPAINANAGTQLYTSANTRSQADTNGSTLALVAGSKYWLPIEYCWALPITTIAVEVSTFQAGNLRIGMYDWASTGYAGNLLTEFTASTQIDVSTSNGIKAVTPATPFWTPPGWYWMCIQANINVSLRTYVVAGSSGGGGLNQRDLMYFSNTGTYGALPTTGDTTSLTAVTRSGNIQPSVLIK